MAIGLLCLTVVQVFICPVLMVDITFAVCLFGMHHLQKCWTDFAEILHRDRGLSRTPRLAFWCRSPQGPTMGVQNVVFLSALLWQRLIRQETQLSQRGRARAMLHLWKFFCLSHSKSLKIIRNYSVE